MIHASLGPSLGYILKVEACGCDRDNVRPTRAGVSGYYRTFIENTGWRGHCVSVVFVLTQSVQKPATLHSAQTRWGANAGFGSLMFYYGSMTASMSGTICFFLGASGDKPRCRSLQEDEGEQRGNRRQS